MSELLRVVDFDHKLRASPFRIYKKCQFQSLWQYLYRCFFPQEGLRSYAVRVHIISLLANELVLANLNPWVCLIHPRGAWEGWETEEQHRELIISPIWFSLMTPHDQQPACRGGKVVQGEQQNAKCLWKGRLSEFEINQQTQYNTKRAYCKEPFKS